MQVHMNVNLPWFPKSDFGPEIFLKEILYFDRWKIDLK